MLILARLLVPGDFGIVAVATSISGSIDALSQIGVRDALVRLHDEHVEYYNTAFTLQVARGLLTALLLTVISTFADAWLGDARLQPILLLMAGLAVATGFENLGIVRLSRQLDFRMQFIVQIAPRLLGFAVTVSLAYIRRDYSALLWGMIVSRLAGIAITYIVSPHWPRLGLAGWRYLVNFSLWTWAGSLAMIVWSRSDPFLLGPALGPAAFGIYLLASEIALLPISELLEPVCTTLFPGFAFARRMGTAPIQIGLTIACGLALCTVPFSIGISACSGYLVSGLLGDSWQAAQPVIARLAWVCMFSPFSFVCSNLLSAQGQVWRVFASNATAAVIKVTVILIVRQTHDMDSIAMASIVVVAIESFLFIWQLRAVGNGELGRASLTMLRATGAAIPTVGILLLLPGTWEHVSAGRLHALVEGGAIGALTFVVFGLSHAALWMACGRPDGAERQLSQTLARLVSGRV
jgi:O-antigen/teichoic acid export membrane protein